MYTTKTRVTADDVTEHDEDDHRTMSVTHRHRENAGRVHRQTVPSTRAVVHLVLTRLRFRSLGFTDRCTMHAHTQTGCPSCHPTNSVKALKAHTTYTQTAKTHSHHRTRTWHNCIHTAVCLTTIVFHFTENIHTHTRLTALCSGLPG